MTVKCKKQTAKYKPRRSIILYTGGAMFRLRGVCMYYTKKMHKTFASVFWSIATVAVLARIVLAILGVL